MTINAIRIWPIASLYGKDDLEHLRRHFGMKDLKKVTNEEMITYLFGWWPKDSSFHSSIVFEAEEMSGINLGDVFEIDHNKKNEVRSVRQLTNLNEIRNREDGFLLKKTNDQVSLFYFTFE